MWGIVTQSSPMEGGGWTHDRHREGSLGPVQLPGTGASGKAVYLTASLSPGQNRESDPEREMTCTGYKTS